MQLLEDQRLDARRRLCQSPQEHDRRQYQHEADQEHEPDVESFGAGEVPPPRPAAVFRRERRQVRRHVTLLVEQRAQRQERMNRRQPARLRALRRRRVEVDGEVEEVQAIEQKPADQVDHDQHVEAEDGAAGADLERGDRHGDGSGDERGRGGDGEGERDAADGDPAENLRDGEDRDAAHQQRDDEEQAREQRPEDDLPIGQRRGQQDVVRLAVLLLRDRPGGEHGRQQRDQPELEIAHLLEHFGRNLGQLAEAARAHAPTGPHEGENHDENEQREVSAADKQIPPPLPAGFDNAQQNGIRRNESPEIFVNAEHESGFGFRVSGFGFRASGFGFRASGFAFRVSGIG